MSSLFGGSDTFFTRPFSSLFGSSRSGSAAAHKPSGAHGSKGPVIQELDSDSEELLHDRDDVTGKDDKYQENAWANKNPHVEHPDDQTDDHNKNTSKSNSKGTSYRTDHSKVGGKQGQTSGVSFQRVTYGGINGPYYTASRSRKTGSDGMVFEESRQADSTTGEATHRISRGIHEKGHSLTRKLNSDGKVDATQTLHNLDEDELASFDETWKGNADRLLPRCNGGFDFQANSGAIGALPFWENFGRQGGFRTGRETQAHSAGGRPKKVVTIPIE